MNFSSILLTITEACPVGCVHCGFIGSRRNRETDQQDLTKWVGQACVYGIPAIIFTGGEPFFRYDLLRTGILTASKYGVHSSVFTSSFWASSVDVAVTMLRGLRGLRHLYLSTDIYHQRCIPYKNVHNVITAAEILGISEITLCIIYANERDRLKVRENYSRYGKRLRFYESRVIPTAFNTKALKSQEPMLAATRDNFNSNCWVYTPIINPNGDIFTCHIGAVGAHKKFTGLPYWLGNLQEHSFGNIMESARLNLAFQYLRTHGPMGIVQLCEEYPDLLRIVGRNEFTGACDLCFSILSTEDGKRFLIDYVNRPEVLNRINTMIVLKFRERPFRSP